MGIRFLKLAILTISMSYCAPEQKTQGNRTGDSNSAWDTDYSDYAITFSDTNESEIDPNCQKQEELEGMSTTRRMNPEEAEAKVNPLVEKGPSDYMNGHESPKISIEGWSQFPDQIKADYVEILRCNINYEIRAATESESLNNMVSMKHVDREEKRYAWLLAKSNTRVCKIVQEYMNRATYEDIAATDCKTIGEPCWYYAINPCISGARSTTRRNECSYNLSFTKPFFFENGLRGDLLKSFASVAKAESEIWRLIQLVKTKSDILNSKIVSCENAVAKEMAEKAFWRGIIKISAFLIAGAACGAMGGGPNGAQICAMMAIGFAPMLDKKLGIDPIQNTCVAGEALGPEGETEEEMEAKFASDMAAIISKIENWDDIKWGLVEKKQEEIEIAKQNVRNKKDEICELEGKSKGCEPDGDEEEKLEEELEKLEDKVEALEDELEDIHDGSLKEAFKDELKNEEEKLETYKDKMEVAKRYEGTFKIKEEKDEIATILRKAEFDDKGIQLTESGDLEIALRELQIKMDEAFNVTQDIITKEQWMKENELDPDQLAQDIESAVQEEAESQTSEAPDQASDDCISPP